MHLCSRWSLPSVVDRGYRRASGRPHPAGLLGRLSGRHPRLPADAARPRCRRGGDVRPALRSAGPAADPRARTRHRCVAGRAVRVAGHLGCRRGRAALVGRRRPDRPTPGDADRHRRGGARRAARRAEPERRDLARASVRRGARAGRPAGPRHDLSTRRGRAGANGEGRRRIHLRHHRRRCLRPTGRRSVGRLVRLAARPRGGRGALPGRRGSLRPADAAGAAVPADPIVDPRPGDERPGLPVRPGADRAVRPADVDHGRLRRGLQLSGVSVGESGVRPAGGRSPH